MQKNDIPKSRDIKDVNISKDYSIYVVAIVCFVIGFAIGSSMF